MRLSEAFPLSGETEYLSLLLQTPVADPSKKQNEPKEAVARGRLIHVVFLAHLAPELPQKTSAFEAAALPFKWGRCFHQRQGLGREGVGALPSNPLGLKRIQRISKGFGRSLAFHETFGSFPFERRNRISQLAVADACCRSFKEAK